MPLTIATEAQFLNRLIEGDLDPNLLLKNYALLAEEILEITEVPHRTSTHFGILSGLIKSKQIRGLTTDEIVCRKVGELNNIRDDYLSLTVTCDRNFIHNIQIDDEDIETFDLNQVTVRHADNVNLNDFVISDPGNVIRNWSLEDGGTMRPAEIFLGALNSAVSIKVYDRFFNSKALDVLVDLIEDFVSHNQLKANFNIEIGVGQGNLGVDEPLVRERLGKLFVSVDRISVFRTSRKPGFPYTHDRYMQVNANRTYVLSAGFAAFVEAQGGRNRASSIFEADIINSRTVVTVEAIGREDFTILY